MVPETVVMELPVADGGEEERWAGGGVTAPRHLKQVVLLGTYIGNGGLQP